MPHHPSQSRQRCRQLCLLTFGLFTTLSALAQRTQSYQEPDYHYRNGLELFERSNYAAARYEFRQYLEPRRGQGASTLLNTNDQNAVDAEYYIALTSLYVDEPGAELLVDRFVKNHSAHPKASQLYGDLGSYYFAREDYTKAIGFLEKAVAQGGNNSRYKYQLALSYYNTQDLQRALPLLNEVKLDPNSTDAPAASYYAGVINFRNRNFNEAVADFRRVETNPIYQNQVPNWIAQALYRQRRFDDLLAYTEPLLRRSNGAGLSEVALFTAEVYYQQNQFAKAIPYYKQYIAAAGAKAPGAVRFRYGQSLFRTGAYPDAITQLKSLATGKDTTAQYAAYTLGVSYLQTQNPTYALNAFDQAGRLSFNRDIQEEARFNHAKLLVDQNNGADAVKELTAFLKQYPDSKFENEANELVGEAYFASNNYPAAIAYIEGLKRRTPRINTTYQRLTYNQGVNEFNAERYPQAVANLDKSLRYPVDNALQQAAQFWKAEAYSAGKQYDTAIPLYASIAKGAGEYASKSLYALGYAYYNKKDYARALPYFRDFVSRKADNDEQAQVLDATIRLADAYFAGKQYENAMRYYDQAIARNAPDKDYAAYQKAVILSYVGRDAEAKAQFDQVQRQFPNSRFVDESLFQTANVDFEKGAYQVAIRGFSKLIDGKPNSKLVPAALLKRAIAYGNLQQYDPAVADYKRILDNYGDSEQAQSALLGIQNTLNDAGRPEEFSQVLGQYKKSNPGSTDVERVQFENARNIYANEKYAQAIQSFIAFLQEYPASPNLNEARYYLAESYRQTDDATNALRYFNQIITDNRSSFLVRAATRAAELETQQKNYPRAIRNYQLIISKADDKAAQVTAQLGLMDTYFAMPKPDSAAAIARDVVTGGNVVPGAQNRAQLMLGKVAFAKGDYKTAQTELDKTIALGKDVNGAEALYYLGDILYKQKKYKESIASLLKFNEQFGDFEYWKGKAFMLVADNNVALEETAQAKAVLNSIIENSSDQTIVAEAKQKLATLDSKN
ncbi:MULTISPECIES: tetratricopeptide repeat protein [Spirosoma]|uniref:Tetratricopeptide repeat protein n=1 Tax=Spirosoma sordidisoli TaxID=2502893 RepID=A0A4Q2UGA2_9BACT|nr:MULTISPECIES: tetratricopeptide repeat protein [Spirosoma]RYC66425.1 tetratricopeptide repeat protein [Spirosoma sordidisoli]